MYLNLLFKSLKLDENINRVKAFVKRFLQALMTGPGFEPSFICGGLFLLGEVLEPFSCVAHPGVTENQKKSLIAFHYHPRVACGTVFSTQSKFGDI